MATVSYLHGGVGEPEMKARFAELQSMLGVLSERRREARAEVRRLDETLAQLRGGLIETEMWLARIGGGSGSATPAAPPDGEQPDG